MHRADCLMINDYIEAIVAAATKKATRVDSIERLERVVKTIEKSIDKQDRRALMYASSYLEILRRERCYIYKKVLRVDRLKSVLEGGSLASMYAGRISSVENRLARLAYPIQEETPSALDTRIV